MPRYDWANCGSVDVFWNVESCFITVGVGVILGNGRGIQGQNYVPSLRWSKATVGFQTGFTAVIELYV